MPTPERGLTCTYELDDRLILRRFGPGWDETAIENGAPELVSPHLVGRPLLMFLSDATTVHLYELLFKRVADMRRPITVPMRCDGAARRRFLQLTIAPLAAGGFTVTTLLVRSEARLPILLFEPHVRRRPQSLAVCSWCQRAEAQGRWVEVEEAVSVLRLFEVDSVPQVTAAVCESCERFLRTLLHDPKFSTP
jgi:hypothetical protein